jgi:hypothetical protein
MPRDVTAAVPVLQLTTMLSSAVRRSLRNKPQVNYTDPSSFPDGPPSNDLEKFIATMNSQSWRADTIAYYDRIFTYAFFASKNHLLSYTTWDPSQITADESSAPLTRDQVTYILNICQYGRNQRNWNITIWETASKRLTEELPNIFKPSDRAVCMQ